ncbi:MAG TPA: ABC transporter permease [Ktedonobacterales bacterium]|nr:ABC transporter permease [Ktedonobacterales bacterium]
MRNMNAILTLAYREVIKFVRSPQQLFGTLIFSALFIPILGGSLQQNLGKAVGFNFLTFVFTGILMQSMFSTTMQGINSLLEDRESDFTQEIFVAPIARSAIIFGKIAGASVAGLLQGTVIVVVGAIAGVPLSATRLIALLPVMLLTCLLGGGFGVIVMSIFSNQRSASQIVQVLFAPMFFLAGIFTPIRNLALPLDIISHLTPLRYAVDLGRNIFYAGSPEYNVVTLQTPLVNLVVITAMMVVFLTAGTMLFVRNERNK